MNADNIHILIADDDRDITKIIADILKTAGYTTHIAHTGNEAMDIFKNNTIHLIILDVMMPGENGLMTAMKVRKESNVPILMLSAKTEESDRVIGLEIGADDYMTKPFYREELLAKVKSLLRRYMTLGSITDSGNENVITYHDLTLDKEKRSLSKLGETIKLTATEYKIVELLLSRPGRVFPAEEIYERVWQEEAYSVENTVMIHISRIRSKIETNPNKPEYLKVVWGIGYKIEK